MPVDASYVADPEYEAVIVSDAPVGALEDTQDARPLLNCAVHRFVEPTVNATDPVGSASAPVTVAA